MVQDIDKELEYRDTETEQRLRDLGNVSISASAKDVLDNLDIDMQNLLERYVKGDYGHIKQERMWSNDLALYQRKGMACALYQLPSGQKIVVSTRFNQPVTNILVLGEAEETCEEL